MSFLASLFSSEEEDEIRREEEKEDKPSQAVEAFLKEEEKPANEEKLEEPAKPAKEEKEEKEEKNEAASGKTWFVHSKEKNETHEALEKALVENGNGLVLLFVGKPGCSICAAQWKKLNVAKLEAYLAEKKIVGLKIEDSAAHYQALISSAKTYRNPDESKTNDGPPFLVIFKAKASSLSSTGSISLKKNGGDCETFICGSTPKYVATFTPAKVTKWLDTVL